MCFGTLVLKKRIRRRRCTDSIRENVIKKNIWSNGGVNGRRLGEK
jgi:ATP-dependent protease HslVU (ClpYQ) ATPase subunit